MDKRFGLFILLGMIVGAMFGVSFTANGNQLTGVFGGAVAGVFVGWFIAAAVREKTSR